MSLDDTLDVEGLLEDNSEDSLKESLEGSFDSDKITSDSFCSSGIELFGLFKPITSLLLSSPLDEDDNNLGDEELDIITAY